MARLIDADEMIKGICFIIEDSKELLISSVVRKAMLGLVDRIKTIGGWISVNEKLPDDETDVLAYLRNGEETRIAACCYARGVWYDCVMNCVVVIQDVTHWMPLPEPPKEDEDDAGQ